MLAIKPNPECILTFLVILHFCLRMRTLSRSQCGVSNYNIFVYLMGFLYLDRGTNEIWSNRDIGKSVFRQVCDLLFLELMFGTFIRHIKYQYLKACWRLLLSGPVWRKFGLRYRRGFNWMMHLGVGTNGRVVSLKSCSDIEEDNY